MPQETVNDTKRSRTERLRMNKTIREIMTMNIVSVRPDTDIETAADLMLEHRVSGMPVVDADSRPLGIVSQYDLLKDLAFPPEIPSTVGDYMTEFVSAVSPDDDIQIAIDRFLFRHYRRLAVVEQGRLVGIVSRFDVLRLIRSWRRERQLETAGVVAGE